MLNFLHSAVNQLFAIICSAIYGIMILVYKLFYSISNTGLIEESYQILAKNVYTILGVLMIFKLAFSIIQYIIDPDQFSNKENGFSALIKNVFIVLVLILVVPIAFSQARRLQIIILSEDIVGRVITGKNMSSLSSTNKQSNAQVIGEKIAFNILSGFVRPNSDLAGCEDSLNMDDSTMVQCINSITTVDSVAGPQYQNALNSEKYTELLKSSIMFSTFKNSQGDKVLTFDFNGIFASICGGFTVYILFIFCIDIAVRSVKFSFLQMFAPIPIVSYIDPKSKKQLFDKWVKVSISTYLDLFIRLAAIYFAVYLIQIILSTGLETTELDSAGNLVSSKPGVFVRIFMILGLLMFAKQLPNLIKDLTGLDLGGKFTLNPLKKIQDEALFGKQVAGGLQLGGRTARNAALGVGALGAAGLGWTAKKTGLASVANNVGDKFNNVRNRISNSKAVGAVRKAGSFLDEYSGNRFSRIGTDVGGTIGSSLTKSRDDRIMANNDKIIKAFDTMKSMALDDIKGGKAGDLSREYARRQAELSSLRNLSWEKMTDDERDRFKTEHNGADLQTVLADKEMDFGKWYNKIAVKEFVNRGIKNDPNNEALYGYEISDDFKTALSGYGTAASLAGEEILDDYDSIKEQRDGLNDDNNKIKNRRMAQQEAKK